MKHGTVLRPLLRVLRRADKDNPDVAFPNASRALGLHDPVWTPGGLRRDYNDLRNALTLGRTLDFLQHVLLCVVGPDFDVHQLVPSTPRVLQGGLDVLDPGTIGPEDDSN